MGIPASRKSARDVLRVSSMMLSYVWPCNSTGISTASFYFMVEWRGRRTTAELDMAGEQRMAAFSLVRGVSGQRVASVSRDASVLSFRNAPVPTTSGISAGSLAGHSRRRATLSQGQCVTSSPRFTTMASSNEKEAMTPALPPGLADLNAMPREAFLKQMSRHPLFMQNLNPHDPTENVELEALQALAYEGTPLQIATNFKEQGNEAFHERRFRDALEFYSKGLGAKAGNEDIERTLYLNRAAANLELGTDAGLNWD